MRELLWTTRTSRVSPFGTGSVCNSADYLSYANGLAQWIVREETLEIRRVVQTMSELIRLSGRPVIIREEKETVMDRVNDLMTSLEQTLPHREHSILIHVMQHIIAHQYEWGVIHLMIFERVNLIVKQAVCSRRFVEASVAKQLNKMSSVLPDALARSVNVVEGQEGTTYS